MAENHIYLTVGKNPKGKGLLAVMTYGSLKLGDKRITVLTLEIVKNMKAAERWFKQMTIERPWETRQ